MSNEHTLNRAQTDALFDNEAILFGKNNGIPEYRIVELFGERIGAFIEQHTSYNGYLKGGEDWNGWGECSEEHPLICYITRAGFYKIVSEHNYRLTLADHRSSEAGRIVDSLRKHRREEMEAAEAEEERKREERRAKRTAARKAKDEA